MITLNSNKIQLIVQTLIEVAGILSLILFGFLMKTRYSSYLYFKKTETVLFFLEKIPNFRDETIPFAQ